MSGLSPTNQSHTPARLNVLRCHPVANPTVAGGVGGFAQLTTGDSLRNHDLHHSQLAGPRRRTDLSMSAPKPSRTIATTTPRKRRVLATMR
jgi:hypothetical protein